MRRKVGGLLLVGGTGVLLLAGAQYARGAMARDSARAQWAALEARQAANASLGDAPAGPIAPGTPVARLVIPGIELDEVIVEGVGSMELNASPGHLPDTPLPGAVGNAVISAHRDLHFRRLGRLGVGDTLTTATQYHRVTWRITERRVVHEDAAALFQTPGRTLTLTTCWPIRAIGPAPERLLLTAVPVDSTPAPSSRIAVSAAAPERRR